MARKIYAKIMVAPLCLIMLIGIMPLLALGLASTQSFNDYSLTNVISINDGFEDNDYFYLGPHVKPGNVNPGHGFDMVHAYSDNLFFALSYDGTHPIETEFAYSYGPVTQPTTIRISGSTTITYTRDNFVHDFDHLTDLMIVCDAAYSQNITTNLLRKEQNISVDHWEDMGGFVPASILVAGSSININGPGVYNTLFPAD